MCTVVVGNKDVSAVIKTLTSVPFEPLEPIPFSWRCKHPEVYASKILTHCSVVGMSRAIKIEKLDQERGLQNMRDILALHEDASPYIVDIAPASHAASTGVTYVQYLQPHRDVVLAAVQEYISSCPINSDLFPDGPVVVDGGTSQSPTLQDGTVQSSPPTVAAPGRFDSIVANTPKKKTQYLLTFTHRTRKRRWLGRRHHTYK